MRSSIVFALLLAMKALTRIFYRVEMKFIGEVPEDPWRHIRLVVFLHHTSLFEPVFAAGVPNHFLWRIARHGVVPAADKTIKRPIVGVLFRFVARHVVPITRQRDHTWFSVLQKVDPHSMVVIFPEGRMMRRDGCDNDGQPMTVRGGVADIIEAVGEGRMLFAYSGGLHHVQAPEEHRVHLFKRVKMNLEVVRAEDYSRAIRERGERETFKKSIIADLERRRDTNAPADEESGLPYRRRHVELAAPPPVAITSDEPRIAD